ncbi:hypothetical protein BVRB_6g140660 [Beta vulgaris subsp. vulgaris]|nr:hypothetical protein BVRB_6g140660 [Beta vulgaris subsp. vulgaris]
MYITRPLSYYKKSPDSLFVPPPEGPNSGYLVIQDEESLMPSCFGRSKSLSIDDLPLPSNKILSVSYTDDGDEILAVPVMGQPLSSNRYYAIKAHKKHKGEAYACSKDEDRRVSCGGSSIRDVKPRPLDPDDIYQQFEFEYSMKITCTTNNGYIIKSVATDGHAPRFLRNTSPLQIQRSTANSKDFILEEANGLDTSLRKHLPSFNFSLSRAPPEPVCVGKWYCPFMFIHDAKLKDQMNNSVYYEMTLEQRWERIFTAESSYNQGSSVMMDVVVPIQEVAIGGKDAVLVDERSTDNKVIWFRSVGNGEQLTIGLNKVIVERMIWEQERVGWVNSNERQVRVIREEEYGGIGWWAKFGCYVLVERFVLKRMDGSVVLTCDFKHTHQIKTKWE